jgi:hypothetical protein
MDELLRTLLDISSADVGGCRHYSSFRSSSFSSVAARVIFSRLRKRRAEAAFQADERLPDDRPIAAPPHCPEHHFKRYPLHRQGRRGYGVACQRKESARIEIWDTGCGLLKTRPKRSSRNFIAAWQ